MGQVDALFAVDRGIGIAMGGVLARLHFHEDEFGGMPCDEIDLSAARPRDVIAGDDGAAVASQVTVGDIFAEASVVVGMCSSTKRVGGAIDQSEQATSRLGIRIP